MTIKDLAKLSGYSLGTVSRVLNNQPNVSEQARKTILALVEEHGFERNASAQLLKQQRTKSVLIIVKVPPTRCSRRWWKSCSRCLRIPTIP